MGGTQADGGAVPGRVRPARPQEIDRIAALWGLITEHHASLDPLFRMRRGPVAEGELRELLRALRRDPDAEIFLFDVEGTPVGLCIVRIDHAPPILEETERAEISDVGVRPEWRRRGYARHALLAAESIARSHGYSGIALHVFAHNAEAQALYRVLGYKVASINMLKPLDPGDA